MYYVLISSKYMFCIGGNALGSNDVLIAPQVLIFVTAYFLADVKIVKCFYCLVVDRRC